MNRSTQYGRELLSKLRTENRFPLLAREGRLGASVAKAGPHSHPDGRISSINRLFAASNGLTNLTPANSKPSRRSSVTR